MTVQCTHMVGSGSRQAVYSYWSHRKAHGEPAGGCADALVLSNYVNLGFYEMKGEKIKLFACLSFKWEAVKVMQFLLFSFWDITENI